MFAVLVPATWNVPGAGPLPTTPNKGNAEGRVEPLPTDVGELMSVGEKLPGALFEAEGDNGAGGRIGVRVGVYDTGGGEPIAIVKEAAARLVPDAALSRTNLLGTEAVRTLQRSDDEAVGTKSVICDYWARIRTGTRSEPSSFILLRFWRTGPASPDEEELFDDIAGSFLSGGPASFTGPARLVTVRRYAPPDSEVAEPGRFRYAGWRLGSVFHTKMISAKEAELATEMGINPRDGLLFLLVFFAWVASTLAFIGVGTNLLVGGATSAGTFAQLRSRGLKAVAMLAVFLGGLLAFGIATS
jgi:hypothetical protein